MALLPYFTPQADLKRRLARLARLFPVQPIAAQTMDAPEVVDYYEQCFDAYRHHHSDDGAVHMALNDDGRFDPDGYYGPLRRIEAAWQTAPPSDVLELGYGHGFNLGYLAPRHPATQFRGIDLTPRHYRYTTKMLRARGVSNVRLKQGDFHHLPYRNASFDHIYCIEAFCHATDPAQALAEQARVLRPGGCLTLFDGYLPRPMSALNDDERLAITLIAKGMAVDAFQVIPELHAQADAAGLDVVVHETLDDKVLPTMDRLERLTRTFVYVPWLGRRWMAKRPLMRGRNVMSGYLMPRIVRMGVASYRQFTFRKRG